MPDLIAVLLAALAGALAAPPAGSLARERTRSAVATAPRAALHAAVAAPGASSPQSVEAVRGPSGRRKPLRDALLGAVLGLAAAGASLAGETGARLLGTALLLSPALVLMTAACWVDLRVHRLPNRLLGAAAVLVVTRAVLAGAWSALVVGTGLGLVLLVLALARTGLGMGDVKLEAVLGTWLGTSGPWTAVQGLVGGLVIGGVVALALVMAGRAGRRTAIALGPSLLAGAVLAWAGALAG
ncbi:A24 family peptidase [Actinomyces radicidentis]|uniref:A24 family peptidase n=1 Tax=Actinomyces radicidentis TaxID=111015 RepID=UPI0028EB31AA|nr:A24 family peptidase [Actinomyces radicidentis]